MLKTMKRLYKDNLTFKESSKIVPLTKLSILLILILNIFIFSFILTGISFQTKVVNNPNVEYPYECRDIVGNSNRVLNYKDRIYNEKSNYNSYQKHYVSANTMEEIYEKELNGKCRSIYEAIDKIKNDVGLLSTKNLVKNNREKITNKEKDLNYIRNNYNTVLFEKMANHKESVLDMDINNNNIKMKYDILSKNLEKYKKIEIDLINNFKNYDKIKELYNIVNINKDILDLYNSDMRYYNIKKALIAILFSLPLVIYFYYRMKTNNRKQNYSSYMINKNLMVVSSIPFIYNFISIIYNLIPHTFINKILLVLYSINIPFIAYYILIGIFVFILTFIVIKIQNKKESVVALSMGFVSNLKFYNSSVCMNCENRVNYVYMNYCPSCSNELKEKCDGCREMRIKGLLCCQNCGEKIEDK